MEAFLKSNRSSKDYHFFHGWWAKKEYVDAFMEEKKVNCFSNKETYQYWIKKITSNKESVSIHIRRADYINNQDIFKILTKQYYLDSLDFISLKLNRPKIYIFSDDIQWCKSNFSGPYYFVSDGTLTDLEEFDLMSKCRHNIIANSTFSWWAAKLNEFKEKIIVMPLIWFNNPEFQDLYKNGTSVLSTLSSYKL